jgi:hypothetical protein
MRGDDDTTSFRVSDLPPFSPFNRPSIHSHLLCLADPETMKLSLSLAAALALTDSCWALSSAQKSRRAFVTSAMSTGILGILPSIATAGLLDDFGADPTTISQKTSEPVIVPAGKKSESSIEPNLRSNYYYPTNKKRYLPRIKKCSDAIPEAAAMIGDENWSAASDFALKVADDTVLPLKLYTSSLTGGGTNVKVSYTKTMSKCADDFEKYQKQLVKAIAKQDISESSTALEGMASALQTYRTVGNLLGPDGGGDIPSVDEIRRSACRVQGRRFEQKIKERDARLNAAMAKS